MSLVSERLVRQGVWVPFVPTFQASGGGAAIGSAVVSAAYIRDGDLVIYEGSAIFAADTNFGSGQLAFTLPVTAHASIVAGPGKGPAYFADTGTKAFQGVADVVQAANQVRFQVFQQDAGDVSVSGERITAIVPFSWGNTDVMGWQIQYRAAV